MSTGAAAEPSRPDRCERHDRFDDLLRAVKRIVRRLPEVPRLASMDAVVRERERFGAAAEPSLAPLLVPAARWRLRVGGEPAV